MLNLLLKLKSLMSYWPLLIALASLAYGIYWHSQYTKAIEKNVQLIQQMASCTANQQLLQSSVQRWQTAARLDEEQLKRKEALVAQFNQSSNQRLNDILQAQYSPDCDKAIKQGVNDALKFNWNNNIP